MGKHGLEGVVASDSAITLVDGEAGHLYYRGYAIEDLAESCCFEEVAHLLWLGRLPNRHELEELRRRLSAHRPLTESMGDILRDMPASAPAMSILRTCVSFLGLTDPRAESNEAAANLEIAEELTAQIASIVASIHRFRHGYAAVRPEPGLSHAGNFLYMLKGEHPTPLAERVFDGCLVLHADHEFNASTFAARVVASTLSDVYSAVTAGIAALRGPLHGGANQKVMVMLKEIGTPARAEAYVKDLLRRKEKVMGFGHRVYKTIDPRATILKRWARRLSDEVGDGRWLDIAEIIERVMREEKDLDCNVDFYSAPVYHLLGIPEDLFTPIFAVSRTVGWTAHILEQYANNRLIRPISNYIGEHDRKVVPLERRA